MLRIGIECESIEDQSWGVGRIVKKLLEEIARRPELKNEFKFFLYFKSRIPNLPFLNDPIFVKKVVKLPLWPPSFSLYYYLFLPLKLWFEKLDLMFFPNYMLPLLFRGNSLVVLTDDIYYEINSGTLPIKYRLAYKIFSGWAARHANKIMTVSEASKSELIKLFEIAPDRIVINTLGIDPPKTIQATQLRQGFVGQASYELRAVDYILYVGQAFPRRHLKETMLAFELIASKFPNLKLIAIGKDKYNPPIIGDLVKKINGRLGRDAIIYKDYVPEEELVALYANAQLVIYVSSKEAFGLPPLEALSYGMPAVVADQPVTREIFEDNAFFVANPDNPNSIAKTMAEGLTNEQKRREIIESAPKILEKYTWQKHTDNFLEIIKL